MSMENFKFGAAGQAENKRPEKDKAELKTEKPEVTNEKKLNTDPDDLIYKPEVVEFKGEVKQALKAKGKDFFDLYGKVIAELKETVSKEDLDKSPFYHGLIGSSGLGKNSLQLNSGVDNQVVEIFKKHFSEEAEK